MPLLSLTCAYTLHRALYNDSGIRLVQRHDDGAGLSADCYSLLAGPA